MKNLSSSIILGIIPLLGQKLWGRTWRHCEFSHRQQVDNSFHSQLHTFSLRCCTYIFFWMEIEVKYTSASTKLSQFHWVQFHFYFNAHHKCAFPWGKWNRDYCWLGKWNRDYEVSSEVEFFFLRHEIFCPQKVLNKAKLRLQGVKVFKLCGFIVKIKKKTFHSM